MNIAPRGLLKVNTTRMKRKPSRKASKKAVKQQVQAKQSKAEEEAYQKDVDAFNADLIVLLKKYNLALMGVPHYNQVDQGAFVTSTSVRAVRPTAPPSQLAKG